MAAVWGPGERSSNEKQLDGLNCAPEYTGRLVSRNLLKDEVRITHTT